MIRPIITPITAIVAIRGQIVAVVVSQVEVLALNIEFNATGSRTPARKIAMNRVITCSVETNFLKAPPLFSSGNTGR